MIDSISRQLADRLETEAWLVADDPDPAALKALIEALGVLERQQYGEEVTAIELGLTT